MRACDQLVKEFFRPSFKLKEIPYSLTLRAAIHPDLIFMQIFKRGVMDAYIPVMTDVTFMCHCCLCNQCNCCAYQEFKGRECTQWWCQCRYRSAVFCSAVGRRVQYPRNKPLENSAFLLQRMTHDRIRDKLQKAKNLK